jgi:hypothetical protein
MRLRKEIDRQRARSIAGWSSASYRPALRGRTRTGNRLTPELVPLENRRLLATINVTSPLDTFNSNGTPSTGTLRWAVEQADAASTSSTINFDLTTPATITLEKVDQTLPLTNTTQGVSITIDGPGANLLTISGNKGSGVFQVGKGVTASITGVTITDAFTNYAAVDDLGSLTLSNCTLTANTAVAPGGGLYVKGSATATVTGCTFTGNEADSGGGLYIAGTATVSGCTITGNTALSAGGGVGGDGNTTLTDCTITGNNGFFGAGVYDKGNATVTGCTISDNTGSIGGGIYEKGTGTFSDCTIDGNKTNGGGGGVANDAQLTLTNCAISGDTGANGGAVYNKVGTATFIGCTISGGSSLIDGGNVDNQYGATLNLSNCLIATGSGEIGAGLYNAGKAAVTDCTISGNVANDAAGGGQGGGVANGPLQTKAVLYLTDSTLSGNTAAFGGGGLYNSGRAVLTDCTIAGNDANNGGSVFASSGGGVDNEGTATLVACTVSGNTTTSSGGGIYNGLFGSKLVTLNDTIVAGNTSTNSGSSVANDIVVGSGATAAGSYNLIGTGGTGGLTGAGNIILGNLSPTPPLDLAPLGDYGGPTETMALLPGSLALGAGKAAFELDPKGNVLTTDQRGLALDSPNPDIGAFQKDSLLVNTTVGGTGSPFGDLSLRQAVNLADTLAGASSISFSPTAFASAQTITLTTGQLTLSNTSGKITIAGPAAGVTVSGDEMSRVFAVKPNVTASISGLTITQGSAASGGGLYNQGTTYLANCTLSASSVTGTGGGLSNAGAVTLTDCTVSDNSAADGGGIVNSGTATLSACTLSANSGNVGGGIDNLAAATVALEDTVVAGNLGIGGAPSDIGGSNAAGVNGNYDLVGTGGSGGIVGGSGHDIVLSALTYFGLAPLANYGGPTFTMAILPGSRAIAAGVAINGLTVDQRGVLFASPPDIGAFQDQGFTVTVVAGSTPQATATGAAFPAPLAVTVTATNNEPVANGVVTFTVNPAMSGASANLSAATAIIGGGGVAKVTATANSTIGSYSVTAASAGAVASVSFNLKNLVADSITGLSNQSIPYGTSSVNFQGNLAEGSEWPTGETVAVTLNNVTQDAEIGTDGAFSTTFTDTASLRVSGSPYTVSYAYTSDGTFASASATSLLTVTRVTPAITWGSPAGITYGTALSGTQLDATASAPGTFNYTPVSGTVLKAGSGQTLAVLFTPTDTVDFNTAAGSVTINVAKATPAITWANPANISYGTPLSGSQLDASSSWTVGGVSGSVAGTFAYLPPAGTVLSAGNGQSLSVLFTPTDTADFNIATGSATINVGKPTPTITWANPTDITYGTALSNTQLDAIASVPGTFTYTPAAGTVLSAGAGQTLDVSFTPNDTADYNNASGTAAINVLKATPAIVWANPGDITYGTLLSNTQLDASASVAGTFTYTPATGTLLNAGAGQTLSVSFAPGDATDYNSAGGTAKINVAKAIPTITWANPGDITFGTPLSATQLDAVPSVPGTFTYTPGAGTDLQAGAAQTLSVSFIPTDTTDYNSTTGSALINVDKATPTISWTNPADITYGTALSATQLDASANVTGTLTYAPILGTVLSAGMGQTLAVSFSPTDTNDFNATGATVTINVDLATPVLEVSDSGGTYDSKAFPASVTITGTGPDNTPAGSLQGITPTLTYYDGSGTTGISRGAQPPSAPGSYTAVAAFTGNADYAATRSTPVTFTIQPAAATIALASSAGSPVFGQSVTVVASVSAVVKAAGVPSGTVTFLDNGAPLGTVALDGSGTATLTTAVLAVGSQSITATYGGSADFAGAASGAASESVSRAATQVVLVPHPVLKKKKVVSVGLTAEIVPSAPGAGIPTGSVIFELITKKKKKLVTKTLGTAALGGGEATLTLKSKSVLNQTITLLYSGNENFRASTLTSPKLTQSALKLLT